MNWVFTRYLAYFTNSFTYISFLNFPVFYNIDTTAIPVLHPRWGNGGLQEVSQVSKVVKYTWGLLDQSGSQSLDLTSSLLLPSRDFFAAGQFPEGAPIRGFVYWKDTMDNPSDRRGRRENTVGLHEQCIWEARNQDHYHQLSPPVSL